MAYLTAELITKSFYLSGVVSQNLEVVTGDQVTEGLDLLNAMLAIKSANLDFITCFLERTLIGSNIYLYYLPSVKYPIKICCKFGFTNFFLTHDLSLTLDAFY